MAPAYGSFAAPRHHRLLLIMNKDRPRFRLYMAISLDGFVASPDGSVKWLEPYDPYEVGFGDFLASAGAIVMGRKSYDQMLTWDVWPYPGKRTVVMTRRPLTPTTPDTEASSDPVETIAQRLARETTRGDVWVFGGGELARAFLAADRLDTLELCIVPVLIGEGLPLFGPGTRASNLRLTRMQPYANGLVCVDYEVMRRDTPAPA
jgi:dihydrofolate reductase